MFERLDQIEAKYEELGVQLSDPALLGDQKKFQSVAKQHRDLEPTVETFRRYRRLQQAVAEARAMAGDSDPEMSAMAAEELAALEPRLPEAEEELKVLLLPKDPND